MVKHHDVIGRYVTIEVDDREYKVFYLQNGKGIPLICQHTAGCHNHQWRGLLEDDEIDLISNKLASISDEIAKKKASLEPLTEQREASIQTYNQAQEDYEKAQKRYSYMKKRGFNEKAKKALNEMHKLDDIIRDSDHTKEVRSVPGGISYEGTISDKMTPILISISRLEKEKERLGR